MTTTRKHLLLLWTMAAVVGGIAAAIAYDALPGINWGIWTLAAALGLVISVWRVHGSVSRDLALVLGLACALALGAAATADPGFLFLVFCASATLLAIAMLLAGGARASDVGALFVITAPLRAAARAIAEAVRRAGEGVEQMRGGRSLPAVRGVAIALPIMACFALLFSAADPVFAAWRDDLARTMHEWTFLPRLIFFGVMGGVALGAYGTALRMAGTAGPTFRLGALTPRLGDTERLMIITGVAAIFALFLVLQLSYLFGNAPAVQGSGVTYAEYARRGFGELTVAATLATLLIVGLDQLALRGARERHIRVVSLVLIALVQLLLDSAWHRVALYEDAYGYTASRLYAKVYMAVVTLALLALAYEVWGTFDVKRLVRRVALLGVAALLGLVYWNHQAWIVRRNVARSPDSEKLDVRYLARDLGMNALPELLSAMPHLSPESATRLRACLRLHYAGERLPSARHWYEWNPRRDRALSALRAAAIDLTPITSGERVWEECRGSK